MTDGIEALLGTVTRAVDGRADEWDRAGRLPEETVRSLAAGGLLCAQVPTEHGGLGLDSLDNGSLTAHTGSLCSSLRSLMTSQGIAAWVVQRFGSEDQRDALLPRLVSTDLAAVAFSETGAGSDLSAMRTTLTSEGDTIVLRGHKVWVTGAAYADRIVVFCRHGDGAAAVVVPTGAEGVGITPVAHPFGCRAAGHADVVLDGVRLPADHVLGGTAIPFPWLLSAALTFGRLSVAWGCVGILRACLREATAHAATRRQFGKRLADHQLVAGHLADLLVAERTATLTCEHVSRSWDDHASDMAIAAVLAKQVAATGAARGASSAVQVLGSAGMVDGGPVTRAHRDAKAMEIIEGSTEISRLLLSEHALSTWS
ncbi:acyl-CoA dehydrogenase family protein [Nocardiopsis terrae]